MKHATLELETLESAIEQMALFALLDKYDDFVPCALPQQFNKVARLDRHWNQHVSLDKGIHSPHSLISRILLKRYILPVQNLFQPLRFKIVVNRCSRQHKLLNLRQLRNDALHLE